MKKKREELSRTVVSYVAVSHVAASYISSNIAASTASIIHWRNYVIDTLTILFMSSWLTLNWTCSITSAASCFIGSSTSVIVVYHSAITYTYGSILSWRTLFPLWTLRTCSSITTI